MIQATSALTLCVFSVFKFLIVIALSTVLFNYHLTGANQIGVTLSVLGIALYNYLKYQEIQARERSLSLARVSSAEEDEDTNETTSTLKDDAHEDAQSIGLHNFSNDSTTTSKA